jgi:hypothetical protein
MDDCKAWVMIVCDDYEQTVEIVEAPARIATHPDFVKRLSHKTGDHVETVFLSHSGDDSPATTCHWAVHQTVQEMLAWEAQCDEQS